MEELLAKIKTHYSLSKEAEHYIFSIAKKKTIPKGKLLIRAGQQVSTTFFVNSGCLRSFCIDADGKEHTLQFAIKDWWISDFMAMYGNQPASLSVECLSQAELIEFKKSDLDKAFELFPEFEPFQRHNLERHIFSLQKRILGQLQLSAKERYEQFILQYPLIEQVIPNYHIASFLGITSQSLSRIRLERVQK